MKRILFKRIALLTLLTSIILPLYSPPVHSQQSSLSEDTIYVDQQAIKTKYMMRNGQLLVPSVFMKHTGVRVNWNDAYQSVVFQFEDKMVSLPVGQKYLDEYSNTTGIWNRHHMLAETIWHNNQTFVSLVDVASKLGMNVHYDAKIRKTFITSHIASAGNIIRRGNPHKKLVALTFDDGPDGMYTPQILDILKKKHTPATFFVIGKQVEAHPQMMQRIVSEGHAIANHTWNHPNLSMVTTSRLVNEIRSTQRIMESTVGRAPDIMRPPYGALTKSDALVLQEMGMRVVMWNVDTLDWSGKSSKEILDIVKRDVSPGGIILQHNFHSEARVLDGTVAALPKIIEELRAEGYQFVTIQTLMDLR